MQRAMVFIDFENFNISLNDYYHKKAYDEACREANKYGNLLPPYYSIAGNSPRLDYNKLPRQIIKKLPSPHTLVKTFLFAPKPDDFLMQDKKRAAVYAWLCGLNNQKYFTLIEGRHSARPRSQAQMDISDSSTYYVVEKGTDVNLVTHLITKGFMNAYDTAVIVSSDTDYFPALDILNTLGKTTVIVGVEGQNIKNFIKHSDDRIILNDTFFQSCLRTT